MVIEITKKLNYFFLLIFGLLFLASCLDNDRKLAEILEKEKAAASVLDKIKERGKLVALSDYNSTNYFIYRGTPMGYQYELLKQFSEYLDVQLEIITNNDLTASFESLQSGEVDIIAIGLTKTSERLEIVDFTNPMQQTRQVLVQRKPKGWRKMKTMDEIEALLIRNPIELAQKEIIIQKNTSFKTRLVNLTEEIGDTIYIIEDPDREVEDLIAAVANGEIDYTIADEHIALVNQRYYADIDAKTPVSFSQNLSWVVNKGQDSLLLELNQWISDFNNTMTARLLYNKYFKNPRSVNYARSEYNSLNEGKISPYDDIIKEISEYYELDWRLVASLIYQESGFKPEAKSWVGAYGLMQLMPSTAEMFGIDSTSSPAEQITAGLRFMKWLNRQIPEDVTDEFERVKFVLASYNVGLAHVFDARRLAEKYGRDPNIWTGNVDTFLLQKSNPKYYRDSVVRYGYCRGEEPYNFVIEILERYDHYKNLIKN